MRQKSNTAPVSSENLVRDIRRATRKHHAAGGAREQGATGRTGRQSAPGRWGGYATQAWRSSIQSGWGPNVLAVAPLFDNPRAARRFSAAQPRSRAAALIPVFALLVSIRVLW